MKTILAMPMGRVKFRWAFVDDVGLRGVPTTPKERTIPFPIVAVREFKLDPPRHVLHQPLAQGLALGHLFLPDFLGDNNKGIPNTDELRPLLLGKP